jgi:hypothetical protein
MSWPTVESESELGSRTRAPGRRRAVAAVSLVGAVLLWPSVAAAAPPGASPTPPAAARPVAPAAGASPTGSDTAPAASPTGSSTTSPDGGTVTVSQACAGDRAATDLTVHNGLDRDLSLSIRDNDLVESPVFAQFGVPAGATGRFVWTWSAPPTDVYLVRDDVPDALAKVMLCYQVFDIHATVVAGGVYTDPALRCLAGIVRDPQHGTVDVRDLQQTPADIVSYRPAAGYVGTDSFRLNCLPGFLTGLEYRIAVVARPPVAAAPQPASMLPATGASRLPQTIGIGLGLTLAGSIATWLARRRRPVHNG